MSAEIYIIKFAFLFLLSRQYEHMAIVIPNSFHSELLLGGERSGAAVPQDETVGGSGKESLEIFRGLSSCS
jgi:hypothetical protein